MTERQGDPQKQVRGTTGAAPEAAGDAADEARAAASEQEAEQAAEAAGEGEGEAAKPVDEEAGRPKRRGRRRKAADADADAEAGEADAGEAGEAGAEEDKPRQPARRRRGSAETTAGRKPAPARRGPAGDVVVRARAKYVRCAPRKARLVVDHIRGKSVDEARAILLHTPRAAAQDVLKVLNSAVANAEHNHELDAEELVVHQAYVDEGPTLKRFRPRALGRATRIRKRTSHLTIAVAPKQ